MRTLIETDETTFLQVKQELMSTAQIRKDTVRKIMTTLDLYLTN